MCEWIEIWMKGKVYNKKRGLYEKSFYLIVLLIFLVRMERKYINLIIKICFFDLVNWLSIKYNELNVIIYVLIL